MRDSIIGQRVNMFAFIVVFASLLVLPANLLAQAISQGYPSDDAGLRPGMVVQLDGEPKSDDPVKVERAEIQNQSKIIGLAVSPNDSFALIASSNEPVYVQASGEVLALVSDINGQVKDGDQLTISPLNGVLMRAEGTDHLTFGSALEDFPAQTETYQIDGGSTSLSSTEVGYMRINLNARSFATGQFQEKSILSSISTSLIGSDIGPARVLIALFIFITVLVAEGGIIYGAISSAIAALGRNPLAKKDIRLELMRVVFIAFIVLCVGLGAVYAILWF